MISHLEQQFAVAAFDSWAAVYQALGALKSQGVELSGATVLATQAPRPGTMPAGTNDEECRSLPEGHNVELCRLAFETPLQCTRGPLAAALQRRRDEGAATLADAFAPWLSPCLADDLERQIASGRILLWFEITRAAEHRLRRARAEHAAHHPALRCSNLNELVLAHAIDSLHHVRSVRARAGRASG